MFQTTKQDENISTVSNIFKSTIAQLFQQIIFIYKSNHFHEQLLLSTLNEHYSYQNYQILKRCCLFKAFLDSMILNHYIIDNKNKVMYNIHQYNSAVRMQEQQRQNQQRYAKYLVQHQQYKEKAALKQKDKLQAFINSQLQAQKPFVFEDDHHKNWRHIRQFRDVQDHTKFLSFKTFRHKPHYQMDKYYNERQRKQILELSLKKEHLVKSNVIPHEQRSRSLRCQGPLNPKIQFRQTKKDHEYLQPRLRFTNITDRQRLNETTFDHKFSTLYKSFEMTKSKIGRTIVSPKKDRYIGKKDALDAMEETQSQMSKSRPFYFEREISNQSPNMPEDSPTITLASASKFSPQNSQVQNGNAGRSRTYFKLAKTMQLLGKDGGKKQVIDDLLKRSQFERRKDLTNIVMNLHSQNFSKRPIL